MKFFLSNLLISICIFLFVAPSAQSMNGRSRKARKAITIISKDELIFYNKKQLIVLAQRIYCKKEDLSAWDSKKREEASNIIINIIENDNYEIFLKTFANVLLLKIIDV